MGDCLPPLAPYVPPHSGTQPIVGTPCPRCYRLRRIFVALSLVRDRGLAWAPVGVHAPLITGAL
jgi:hypothetical protein